MAQHEIIITANFVKAAASFASKDASRPILTGIHFANEDGKLVIVATDSYRLIVCETGFAVEDFEPFTIGAKALVDLKPKSSSYFGGTGGYLIKYEDGASMANVTTDFDSFTTIKLVEGKYPNFRNLLPKGGERFTVEPTAINAAFMADACKALTVIDKNAKPTLATRTHKANVLELKGDGYLVTAIVMPVNAGKGELAKYTAAPQGDDETQKKLVNAAARIAELECDYELAQKHYMEAVESVKRLETTVAALEGDLKREHNRVEKMSEELTEAHADGARLCKKGKNKGNWWIKKTA